MIDGPERRHGLLMLLAGRTSVCPRPVVVCRASVLMAAGAEGLVRHQGIETAR
jgi:hypothetical protein